MTTQHAQKKGWISIALIFALGGASPAAAGLQMFLRSQSMRTGIR